MAMRTKSRARSGQYRQGRVVTSTGVQMAGQCPSRYAKQRVLACMLVASLLAAGCETRIDVLGFVPDEASLARLQIGVQQREDVRDLLGTPSTVTPFGDETWLYISRRTSSRVFFEPTIIEQQVVAIVFDERGVVSDIRTLALSDGRIVNHVARATPAPGKELSFLEQLVGNVGRFNQSSGGYVPGGTQAPPPGTMRR